MAKWQEIFLDVEAANFKALQEEIQALRNRWDSLLAVVVVVVVVVKAMDVPDYFEERKKRDESRKGNACLMR